MLATVFSCHDDDATIATRQQLNGRWDLVEAYRNNQLTPSLENLYFEFSSGDSLRTNVNNGQAETVVYKLDDQQIIPQGSSLDAVYQIVSLSDSSLELSTYIRHLPFRFLLRKQ